MADISLTLDGVSGVTAALNRLATPSFAVIGAALTDEATPILAQSQTLVPVLTGLLKSTGIVEKPLQYGGAVSVTIRYGNFGEAPYAAIQEWDTTFNHPRGGQAHYLQQPLFQATAGFTDRLAQRLRPLLGP